MGPDAIFIILLYFFLLILTIGSIIGLSRKIWKSKVSLAIKLLVVGSLVGLLIFALSIFDTVETGDVAISRWEIMIYSASFLIGFNWSINLNRKQVFQRIRIPNWLKVVIMTMAFAVLLPALFYFMGKFFEELNIFGSGG
jgi:hypothetical protein